MYRSKSSNFSPLTFRCNKVESAPMPPCLKSPHLYLVYLQDSNHLIEWGPLTTSECVYTPKLILSVIGSSQEKTWTGWKNDSFIELQVKKQTEPATDENADKLFYNLGKRLVDVKGEATDMLTRQGEDASRVIDDQVRDDQPMNAKPSLRLNYTVTDNPDVDRPTTALRQYILYALTKNEEADDKCIECAITMKDVEDEHTLKAMQEKGVPVLVLKDACKNSNATVIEKSRDWIIHLANGSNSHCEHPILDCNENDFSEKLLDHIISYFRAEGDRGSDERHLAKLRVYLDMKLMYEANEPGTSSLSFKNWILKDDPFTYSLLDLSVMLSRARCVKHCLKHVKTLKESKIKIPDKTLHKDVIQIVNEMLEQDIGNFTSDEHPLKKLFIACLILKKFDISKVLWRRFASPVGAALSAYKLLKVMSETDDCELDKTRGVMLYFQKHAVKSLATCYKLNPTYTSDLLGIRRPGWNNTTYFHIAYETDCEDFLGMSACHDISDRVWHYGSADQTQNSPLLSVTPRKMYIADLFSRFAYLLIYGLLLVRYLATDSFHPLEWLVWALTLFDLLQIVVAIQGFRAVHAINLLGWYISTTFLVAWTLRYLAYSSQENEYLMRWARMAFGLNYIGFSIRFLHGYYADKDLGPMIVMFKNIGFFLLQFFLLILIFFISYGVASQSVYFHGSRYDPLLIFYQSFWTLLGQYPLLDELGFKGAEENYNCTADGQDDDNCLYTAERYFLSIILGVYAVVINILLFNLLIAKFGAIINLDEKKWTQTWHIQSLQLTMMYSKRLVWPPLIVLLQPFWYCYMYKCCSHGDEFKAQDPFIVNKTDSGAFENDVMKLYLEQVDRSESQMERNPLSKWLDADTETNTLMEKVEENLQTSSRPRKNLDFVEQTIADQTELYPEEKEELPNESGHNSSFENLENEDISKRMIFVDEEKKVWKQGIANIHSEFEQLSHRIFSSSRKWEKTSTKISRRVQRLEKELRVAKTTTNELNQAVSRAGLQIVDLNDRTGRAVSSVSEDQVDGDRSTRYQRQGDDYQRRFGGSELSTSVTLSDETIVKIAMEVMKQIKTIRPSRNRLLYQDYNPDLKLIYGKPDEDQANKEVASVVLTGRFGEESSKDKKGKKKKDAYFAVRTRQRYGPLWRCYKVTEGNKMVPRSKSH
ncbi:unnamed protein product [Lymnaea stagnalis]|uniref:TRPM-like domain-containing protein n=1 Tax=Lymnaea stagnalis TaxID=6523 RepID=A0AAV2IKZ3_LYMST